MRCFRKLMLFGLVLVLVAKTVSSQIADAVLEIEAVDESGATLPAVTVSVSSPDTGLQRTAVTDVVGLARVIALPAGTYEVNLSRAGFQTAVETALTLRVGQTARATFTMGIARVEQAVTIGGEAPLVDVFKTDSSTNIVPEQIGSLPLPDRDFQRLAFLTPGVQRERGTNRFIGNGPVIGGAGNASQTTILVDGVDFTDPMYGLARVRFSQDAIREVRVIASRFDAEIGGSSGGALSIITKSGANTMNGSVFGFFRDKSLRTKGVLDLQKNDYSREQFGLTLGGPIVQNRTHYFGSFEQIHEDATVTFRPGGAFASRAADLPLPLKQSLVYIGGDHRINDNQSLSLKFAYERYHQKNFRVGGVVDESAGEGINRGNWNWTGSYSWTLAEDTLNQFWAQIGRRNIRLPNNSQTLAEFFSNGNTLQTGANMFGDQRNNGNVFEFRDTFFKRIGRGRWTQDAKFGGALFHVKDNWNFPLFPHGLIIYADDTRRAPLIYVGTSGSSQDTLSTNLISGFVQTNSRPNARLALNFGVRYDVDTQSNNPDFTSPAMPIARGRDTNNIQPRAGFSWDVTGAGGHVIRGGAGVFTSRLPLSPAHFERMQNGFTGWIIQQRVSGLTVGLPGLAIDPANPTTTGIALPRDAVRNANSFVDPLSKQVTAGYTMKLGRRGLYADVEGVYVKGKDEVIVRDLNWAGNAAGGGRPNPAFNQINTYTNEGRSEYKAFIASLNGTLAGGHLITASMTIAHKKNINDDFQPALMEYPSDAGNIAAEWGRARSDERVRFVASSVLRLPFSLSVAPIFEYGSGQPWNDRIGYDYNGDGKLSDRIAGTPKFSRNGPNYLSVNLRVTRRLKLRGVNVDAIAEAFNLFNRVNYDVNSVLSGRYLSGPTLANPTPAYVANPRYGQVTATLPPFEAQIGLRASF